MTVYRWVIIWIIVLMGQIFAQTANINVQFRIDIPSSNAVACEPTNPTTITFALFNSTITSPNNNEAFNDNNIYQTDIPYNCDKLKTGFISHQLKLNHHHLKHTKLILGAYFIALDDYIYLPMLSVPSTVFAFHAENTKEIEFTKDWFTISTTSHRIGIHVSTLTKQFQVCKKGTNCINTENASVYADIIEADKAYANRHITNTFVYTEITSRDTWSLHRFGDNSNPNIDKKDIVFVDATENVGISVNTNNIKEKLHISGNILIENSTYMGQNSNFVIEKQNLITPQTIDKQNNVSQLIWNIDTGTFQAGFANNDNWNPTNTGMNSVAFGKNNKIIIPNTFDNSTYSFSSGESNIIKATYTIIGGGQSNEITGDYSGILSGKTNTIIKNAQNNSSHTVIFGGQSNKIINDGSSAILGGVNNHILGGNNNTILGGKDNLINERISLSFGKNTTIKDEFSYVFGDGSCTSTATCNTNTDNQFIIHAQHGLGVGTSFVNNFNEPILNILSDFSDKTNILGDIDNYLTNGGVPPHSIRTLGDIIARDSTTSQNLRFLFGDGRYLKNVNTPWKHDEIEQQIYVSDEYNIGIGTATPNTSLHIKKDSTATPTLKIEDNNENYIEISQDGPTSNIVFNSELRFKNNDINSIIITSSDITFNPPLLKMDVGTATAMIITGNTFVEEGLVSANEIFTITMNALHYIGNATGIFNIAGSYSLHRFGTENVKQLVVNSNGNVGIAFATNDARVLLHIKSHVNSPDNMDAIMRIGTYNNYTEFEAASNVFNIEIHHHANVTDPILDIVSSSSNVTTNSLVKFYKGGDIELGQLKYVDVATMSVYYVLSANAYIGNGVSLNKVQLDTPQVNDVTFNETITIIAPNSTEGVTVTRQMTTEILEIENWLAPLIINVATPNTITGTRSGIIGSQESTINANNAFIAAGKAHIINGTGHNSVALGNGHFIGAGTGTAFGNNARINTGHNNTFIYGDGNCSNSNNAGTANCQSNNSNQFLIFAQNGVGIDLIHTLFNNQDVNTTFDVTLTTYSTQQVQKLRVAGDIISQRNDIAETLGYVIGDGRFLKNISTNAQISINQVAENGPITFDKDLIVGDGGDRLIVKTIKVQEMNTSVFVNAAGPTPHQWSNSTFPFNCTGAWEGRLFFRRNPLRTVQTHQNLLCWCEQTIQNDFVRSLNSDSTEAEPRMACGSLSGG